MRTARAIALLALLAACRRAPAEPANPLDAPPVDARIAERPHEIAAWTNRRTVDADLDGDGTPERIVLAADVAVDAAGRPLWEDGHRWAVWVEDADGPTLLYAAFLAHGHAEVAVTDRQHDGRHHVLIQERTPQQARSLVVAYEGSGRARAVSSGWYQLDRWLPDLRTP